MSELGAKVTVLRGDLTRVELAAKAGFSRLTLYNLERGKHVKIGTIRKIAEALNVTGQAWLELLAAWIKSEIGEDSAKMWVEPKDRL